VYTIILCILLEQCLFVVSKATNTILEMRMCTGKVHDFVEGKVVPPSSSTPTKITFTRHDIIFKIYTGQSRSNGFFGLIIGSISRELFNVVEHMH
jgi:hypothetical protein